MTNREASTIAMQELGMTPEQIEHHHKRADKRMREAFGPGALAETDAPVKLKPGQTERDFIEYLKMLAATAIFASKEDYNKLLDHLKKRVEKKQSQN
jgi:hypothetical protein